MKLTNSTKKTVLALALGLGLASSAGAAVNAYAADRLPNQSGDTGKSTAAAQVQSLTDSPDDNGNINAKYGGCGLSCGGCALKCFY